MSPVTESILVSGIGFLITVGSNMLLVSYKMGQFRQQQMDMKEDLATKANLGDLVQIKETLAEIKGMFVLRLRE